MRCLAEASLLVVVEASQAEESILDHILIHLDLQPLVVQRLLELSLVDPIKCLEASSVQVFYIDEAVLLMLAPLRIRVAHLVREVSVCRHPEVEAFIHLRSDMLMRRAILLFSVLDLRTAKAALVVQMEFGPGAIDDSDTLVAELLAETGVALGGRLHIDELG